MKGLISYMIQTIHIGNIQNTHGKPGFPYERAVFIYELLKIPRGKPEFPCVNIIFIYDPHGKQNFPCVKEFSYVIYLNPMWGNLYSHVCSQLHI